MAVGRTPKPTTSPRCWASVPAIASRSSGPSSATTKTRRRAEGGGGGAKGVDGSAVDRVGGGGDVDGEDGGVTVWWAATLVQKTDRMHDLVDDERDEGTTSVDDEYSPLRRSAEVGATTSVRVPIYKLNYAPLEGEDPPPPLPPPPRFVSSCLL